MNTPWEANMLHQECNTRKRKTSHMEKVKRLQHKQARENTVMVVEDIIQRVLDQVGIFHDCQYSRACPDWVCECSLEILDLTDNLR